MIALRAALPLALAMLIACAGEETPPACVRSGAVTDSGLAIEDLSCGSGRVVAQGDSVTVSYVGTLADGTRFDSSSDHGGPITFRLGAGQVIPGWDEGIKGMRTGGTRRLLVPPELALRSSGSPPRVPGNAELSFEITVESSKPAGRES